MTKKIEPYKDIALIYDEVRPSYPEELIQDIITTTALKTSDRILEIGAGTGKATVQFAEKGFQVQAIELGRDMGAVFKEKLAKYPSVSLDIASFEEWVPPSSDKYDLIYCAQAFHWLDINIKYQKCHGLLKDNGFLVLFWYNASNDDMAATKIITQKVNEIIAHTCANKNVNPADVENKQPIRSAHSGVSKADERIAEIEDSNLFGIIAQFAYQREIRSNAEQFLKAQKSVPSFASFLDGLEDETKDRMEKEIINIVNTHGGYVGTMFDYSLFITKKIKR
jgi:SAM-dependent methyltransferase